MCFVNETNIFTNKLLGAITMPELRGNPRIARATEAIRSAEVLVIGAGAGLSAAAGYDFTNSEKFARDYPGMLQYGFTKKIQMMANFSVGENILWGYYLQNVAETRFDNGEPHPVYQALRQLSELFKDWFVVTTNVDALFQRNGFDQRRIYTPQGDYGLGQCRSGCTQETWSSKPWIDNLLNQVDRSTQKLADELIPRCPNCGGPTFFNVRCASWFVDKHWLEGRLRWEAWLKRNRTQKVLSIDIGSGFNTPMWVRWPLEKITSRNPQSTLIRMNRDHPDIPKQIEAQSISFQEDPLNVLNSILEDL